MMQWIRLRAAVALLLCLVALAGTPAAAQTPLFPAGPASGELETLRTAFSCPVGHLFDLYADLTDATEALDVLAVETEVLLICRSRQERLASIASAEFELRRLLGIEDPAGGAARVSIAGTSGPSAPLLIDCPGPSSGAAEDAGEAAESGPSKADFPAPPVMQASAGGTGLPEAIAGLLETLAAPAPAGAVMDCGSWSWLWTGRDHTRRHTAVLVSPGGQRRQVTIGDRLPSGETVTGITVDGVTISRGGDSHRLPPFADDGTPLPPDDPP